MITMATVIANPWMNFFDNRNGEFSSSKKVLLYDSPTWSCRMRVRMQNIHPTKPAVILNLQQKENKTYVILQLSICSEKELVAQGYYKRQSEEIKLTQLGFHLNVQKYFIPFP